jgi:hypothetical protein
MRNDMVTKVSLKCCLYAHADVVVPPLFCRLLYYEHGCTRNCTKHLFLLLVEGNV